MDAGPNSGCIKPEPTRSGFFILPALLAATLWAQPGSLLLGDILYTPLLPLAAAGRGDTSYGASLTAMYHDLYYSRIADTGVPGTVREETSIACPRLRGTARLDRGCWGLAMQGVAGGIAADARNLADGYDLRVDAPMNAVSGGGWLRWRSFSVSGIAGYDRGLDAGYRFDGEEGAGARLGAMVDDPRFLHALSASLTLERLSVGWYESRHPLLSVLSTIRNSESRSESNLPLASADQVSGFFETFRSGRDSLAVTVGVIRTASDRGPVGGSALTIAITGSGNRVTLAAALTDIPHSPWISGSWHHRSLRLRGYDGGASAPYWYLDSTSFSHARVIAGGTFFRMLACGIFAEAAMFHCQRHGQFDPYPFSAFTIFNPVKYRLDTAAFCYRTAGASFERAFTPFSRGRARLGLSVAWFALTGSLDTREYDFSFFLPRLINPRTWPRFDERRLLITPECIYATDLCGMTFSGSLRQLIPLDIAHPGGRGGERAEPSTIRTVRGGTTVALSVEYRR